jgi:hypothetical protein
MKYWFAEGKVNSNSIRRGAGGYIVIYGDDANYSVYDSAGHDELLSVIAVRNKHDKGEVLSEGIRMYFVFTNDGILISGAR